MKNIYLLFIQIKNRIISKTENNRLQEDSAKQMTFIHQVEQSDNWAESDPGHGITSESGYSNTIG